MNIVLECVLSLLAGCVYMMRGGSQLLPKVPRWATVLLQVVIITPFLIYHKIPIYTAPIYCLGWYLTIFSGWGAFFDCKTWKKRGLMFLRMLESFALLAPLALLCHFNLMSLLLAGIFSVIFSIITVFTYTIYNYMSHTDKSFNWSEFVTGTVLAQMTFIMLGGYYALSSR